MNKQFTAFMAATMLFAACAPKGENKESTAPKADIIAGNIDSTVNPGDDFFSYANGTWVKKNPIPADETSWGIDKLVQKELYERLLNINNEAVKKAEKTGTGQQIADFWFSAMDTVSIEKQGIEPLRDELNKINALQTPKDVMAQAAHMHTYGVGVFFDEGVAQDLKKSDLNTYYMSQGGIGLPDRDYYFSTDTGIVRIREAYPAYVASIFKLMGVDSTQAKAKAAAIVALETKLAASSRKLEDLRDPYKNYNKMAISGLNKISSHIDWPATLQQIGVQHIDSVIVGQPEFYKTLDDIIARENIQTLRDYLAYDLVKNFAPYLSQPFVDANFNFYSKIVRGAQAQRPRWKRALDAEQGAMGEALGQLFAKEYFNAMAKKRYEDIVENVRTAYKNRMEKLDWMTDSTRQKAIHKLSMIRKKVGYPDKWKDFSSLKIDRGPYALNMMRANAWWNNYSLNKLGKPVDREEWDMTPQTYNAYYNPSNNEIVLPAGIFTVPGYRDEELDDALVYGYAAASTIGHEITHGFDDEGRQYDENGNLRNWWSAKDEQEFNKRAAVLVKQFYGFSPVGNMHINGKATLGENLADLGGLLIGFDAFKMTDTYKKGEKVNGFTPSQRFFLGYALSWLYAQRDKELATRLLTDVHSPAKFRVNGPLPNVPAFYDAFNVKPGNKMYLPDSMRVNLW